ncbi:MAG: hypothetical protein IT292_08995 [Deltaproteobacteria bacterium]|nr:hypothetical protein [Deltaproteobacteria bacterium]
MLLPITADSLPKSAFVLKARWARLNDYVDNRAMVLGFILIALQLIDAVLTFHGVSALGNDVEGNAFIASLMIYIGPFWALALTKFSAILFILFLVAASRRVSWVKPSLYTLNFIYLSAAILPWCYLLTI